MALRVMGIGAGDEVITCAYTYTASASVIAHFGAKIVLIAGASTYSNGIEVVRTTRDIDELAIVYSNIIVAIGNPEVRLSLLSRIKEETPYRIVLLVSPKSFVSPSAQIMSGCIIEPMAVVYTGCVICPGCIISAGAVVNHSTMCYDDVYVYCNANGKGILPCTCWSKICTDEEYKKRHYKARKFVL